MHRKNLSSLPSPYDERCIFAFHFENSNQQFLFFVSKVKIIYLCVQNIFLHLYCLTTRNIWKENKMSTEQWIKFLIWNKWQKSFKIKEQCIFIYPFLQIRSVCAVCTETFVLSMFFGKWQSSVMWYFRGEILATYKQWKLFAHNSCCWSTQKR